ncbi:fluoride efflux transporter CrcB [Alicyclobacillus fastidiosus]|uniref:Fluoride-specific ion channel FluC n=1 Tax=Alicyclobacillus fastidiosus TaxID=392011 RepID=A0ABY6ZP57_9BACL|nr:fluoride efflux transporter CrcB [Alicyclobacillus fastidiosus]WAH43844.1 fluoride efflux transporter CrcB [Alicyclobacillus fastidiosus]GMA60079.1 putative fluoride ion transporter CrcB [Alicyclobacillus fastidiosus]
MNACFPVLAGVGSAIGAVARYGIGVALTNVNKSVFPWGTWLVNVVGTTLLGLFTLSLQNASPDLFLLLGTGFCGGFTTFSTLSVETVTLFRENRRLSIFYLFSSLGVGLILAWITELWA